MTSPRQGAEPSNNPLLRAIQLLTLFVGLLVLACAAAFDLDWPQQAILGLVTILLAVWIDRGSRSRVITLTLMLLSVYSTIRYGIWRAASTASFFSNPSTHRPYIEAILIGLLLFAEIYAATVLFLGYIQTLWPLRRAPVPLPDDPDSWPAVDLLIPTFNEPLSLVRHTALAALNIDWPVDKLNVYVLDDGRREDFRLFCQQTGIGYITRDDNRFFKAGNLNHAIESLHSPLIAVFDCDHVPTRSFLQVTVGWFLRDTNLAMLQTPQRFYSPNPFERNLDQFHVTPSEDQLFYGVIQEGNDLWNATLFCGSSAVLRRSALDEIGGIAVETVTEDAHTSLRLQMSGWNTAYINLPQAAGLATERLRSHISQRVRWARGMVQILRVENPLFARGLKLAQRLCYFNAMLHFLYAIPRLIFLAAPLVYLLSGRTTIPGYWAPILAYAIPHLALSTIANARIHGSHRHSFWNEIYETVVAPYTLLPTLLAILRPSLGRFPVTEKGSLVRHRYFDARSAWPLLLMIALHLLAILAAIPRLRPVDLPFLNTLYTGDHIGAIALNLLWATFNLVILSVATSVAWESRQRRHSVRLPMSMPADVLRADGTPIEGVTADISTGGVLIYLDRPASIAIGETIRFLFPVLNDAGILPATVIAYEGARMRAEFRQLTLQEQETLALVLYARADTWLGWGQSREVDRPIRSLGRILRLSLRSLRHLLHRDSSPNFPEDPPPSNKPETPDKRNLATTTVLIVLLALLASAFPRSVLAQRDTGQDPAPTISQQDSPAPTPHKPAPPPTPALITKVASLSDLHGPLKLHGSDAKATLSFALPKTQTVRNATLHLRYRASPALIPTLSHLKLSLNGTLLATLPVTQPAPSALDPTNLAPKSPTGLLEADVTLPADSLQTTNSLTFELIGHTAAPCDDPASSALWIDIDKSSTLTLNGPALQLADNLKLLPAPFYDPAFNPSPTIPIVFPTAPSNRALQAAGIVASWLGILRDSSDKPIRFPVSIGDIPHANAILIVEDPSALPPSLGLTDITGPTLAIRANPADPDTKLLILTGRNADDLLNSAQALALESSLLEGGEAHLSNLHLPAPRQDDDAPRWLDTGKPAYLGDIAQLSDLQRTDATPIQLALRLPPDLYLPRNKTLPLHLSYRYNAIPLGTDSSLQIFLNGTFLNSAPLPHGDQASAGLSTSIPIAATNLLPSTNTLELSFRFQPSNAAAGNCQAAAPTAFEGVIQKDSYLDLRNTPHWAKLPNLALFASSGFPFTRKADLAETAIVLPATPTPAEIELYLALIANFAAQTGYPVLNVSVTDPTSMAASHNKDYLVLGTLADQPARQTHNPALPVAIESTGLRLQDTRHDSFATLDLSTRISAWISKHAWWRVRSSDAPIQLQTTSTLPDAILEAIEWPRGSAHSVVLIALRDQTAIPIFQDAFLQPSESDSTPAIAHSVSLLNDKTFVSYPIIADSYHVGTLPLWIKLHLLIAEFPPLLVFATAFVCLLMALVLRSLLRRQARARLDLE